MNYAALKQAIQDYTENFEASFEDNIPNFVKQTEQRIYNAIQLPALRKNVTGAVTANVKYLTVPSDWLATFSLSIIDASGSQNFLLDKDVNYIRAAFPNPTSTGEPTHYAQFDDTTLILGPTPNASYNMEMHYFYYPESIVDAGTSWVGNNYDPVLLYGSLVEAYIYLKGEPDLLSKYQSMFDSALIELKMLGDGKNRQDAYRSGQVRYPVK